MMVSLDNEGADSGTVTDVYVSGELCCDGRHIDEGCVDVDKQNADENGSYDYGSPE